MKKKCKEIIKSEENGGVGKKKPRGRKGSSRWV